MYSRTRMVTDFQLASMQNGIKAVVENHERQRNPVDAHVIGDTGGEPLRLFDELEIRLRRIETQDQDQRHAEGNQRGPQRDPARIALCGLVVAAADIDQQGSDHRQERDDGEDRPGCHHWPPTPNMNQVISPATPISIAKA